MVRGEEFSGSYQGPEVGTLLHEPLGLEITQTQIQAAPRE